MSSDLDRTTIPVAEEEELISLLAERALEQAAPEELALFPETADEYFRDPDAALNPRQRDEAVGFGLELAMLTPYVLAVAKPVVRLLASLLEESLAEELKPSVAQLVRRLLRTGAPAAEPGAAAADAAVLDVAQMRRLRATAYDRGIALGLDEARATLLADSVVGGLVTG